MVKIIDVERNSLAEEARIFPGDTLISINENEINDVLDYRFYLTEKKVKIKCKRENTEYSVSIKKGEYDDIGLIFETPLMDKKHSCKNGCIFCFIDQNPKGLRDTLYFKDDDSRLSFLHGNYITLTNMTDSDVERIVKMRFSPINVSIHTTNPELRVKMMKNKNAGKVLRYLDVFKEAGLSMCGQIVLCKGVNDGEELVRSMNDLSSYYPALSSVSVVPAGLTKYREGLYPLSDYTKDEAREIIALVDRFAKEHKEKTGSRLFFVADELYLKASLPIPEGEYYEDYPQIENGVGMLRSVSDEFDIGIDDVVERLDSIDGKRRVSIATGVAAYDTLLSMSERLMSLTDKLEIKVYKIVNDFFGHSITVSGLLTGVDIINQLSGRLSCDELILPSSALKADEDVFLCGTTLEEVSSKLGVPVATCDNDGFEFIDRVLGSSENSRI